VTTVDSLWYNRATCCERQALSPGDINFVPLTQTRAYQADELMDFYRTDPSVKHIKPYTNIIFDSPVYPVGPTSPTSDSHDSGSGL
jgi:hypothetical protein